MTYKYLSLNTPSSFVPERSLHISKPSSARFALPKDAVPYPYSTRTKKTKDPPNNSDIHPSEIRNQFETRRWQVTSSRDIPAHPGPIILCLEAAGCGADVSRLCRSRSVTLIPSRTVFSRRIHIHDGPVQPRPARYSIRFVSNSS